MHPASLITQHALTSSPHSRAQPSAHLALLAIFCQTGKSGQVKNKVLALEDKRHMQTEASYGSSQKWEKRLLPIQTSKMCPPKEAKRETNQATKPCYIHLKLLTGETQCRN